MSRYVDLPVRGDLPATSLLARISTPLNREATTIDPSHPTILLVHPTWTDSFFFYPQYDEPALFDNYNLVCFDIRGHGETAVEPLGSGSYTAPEAADDAYLALRELGVDHAHVLGVSVGGSSIAFHLAQQHHDSVLSLTMISPHMPVEHPEWTLAFDEIAELLVRAVNEKDAEALDAVTIGAWNWGMGERHVRTESISDLRQRFIDFQRTKLADGRLALGLPYIAGLLSSRGRLASAEDRSAVTCPVLILHGQDAAELGLLEQYNDLAETLNTANTNRHGAARPAQASVICVGDEPQLVSLTSAHVVHPLVLEHVAAAIIPYIESIPQSPMSTQFSRSSRASLSSISSISRRTSSPREMTGFSIPPPPKLGPGVLTLGQVLDREKQEGIPMMVEVRVSVDEGADCKAFKLERHGGA